MYKMNRKLLNRVLMPFCAAVLLMLCAQGAELRAQSNQELREEFHHTYPLTSTGRVSLENINGSVSISVWDRDEVRVDAIKRAYRQERLNEAHIEINADADSVHIKTEYPDEDFNFYGGSDSRRYENPAIVEYQLTVPRRSRIDSVELINGALTIDGVQGDVRASSINGGVQAHRLGGEVRLSTINGGLTATFDPLSDETRAITLSSVNGGVTIIVPSNANATVKASTVHGGITNDFGLPVRHGEYVGHSLLGQLGTGGGVRIRLEDVNGGISIRHAQDGHPLSQATNLLPAQTGGENSEDAESIAQDVAREGDEEMARVKVKVKPRVVVQGDTEEQRAARREQIERERERVRERAERQSERAREQRERQLEQQRAQIERQRELQRAQAERQREQQQTQLEQQREAQQRQREEIARQRAIQRETLRQTQAEIARHREEIARAVREAALAGVRVNTVGDTPRVERETRSFAVSGTPRVSAETFDGSITVTGWDQQNISVTAVKRASTDEQLQGIKWRAEQRGSEIAIVADFDNAYARRIGSMDLINASTNLEISVPRNTTLHLHSRDGRVHVEGVSGSLDLRTGDGSIDVRDGHGQLIVNTGDGRVRIVNFDGDVDARTGDGGITLLGRFASLKAWTGDGSISLALPQGTNAVLETNSESVADEGLNAVQESSAGRVKRWRVGSGGRVFTVHTGDGRIVVCRAEDFADTGQ